ncbi:hypothetical protein [Fulvivirga ligni]|uniref:hypothetical protein n=1 Tax=Fulvivirga ligni TaxID=2904246 RepID=UPI001F1BAD8D|nr:hypothetical protein [Fulvivirga ligni]UII22458.1 hypothetical protein LVD16_04345 [Fulvivirga ligni]
MNPSEKGWLRGFLEARKESFLHNIKEQVRGQNPDQSFYGLIQPTGIMYGYPVDTVEKEHQASWHNSDKVKVILLDTFINIAELYSEGGADDYWQLMEDVMNSVNRFYNGVYPEIATSSTNWLGRKIDTFALTEKILEKRIDIAFKKSSGNFWAEFFYHTQLFLDVYIFSQWSHTTQDQVLTDFFREEKVDLSYTSVKVMAAAAHANKKVETEEQKLFQHFIENSAFPVEKRRVAQEYFIHGLGIQDIPVEPTDSWIIRKFFLELAILTIWSDKKVDDIEIEFLQGFNKSLGFSDDDFDHSMIAVEGFVLQNWHQLDSLQDKKEFAEVSDEYVLRISRVVEKYRNRITKGITEDIDLLTVIKSGVSAELNDVEKEIIKDKLIALLKEIPSFRVIALPNDFLTFNILLRIIPKDIMKDVLQST